MKIIVRSLVVALALTGAIATTYAKAPSAKTANVTISKTSAFPNPTCGPDDPTCGM